MPWIPHTKIVAQVKALKVHSSSGSHPVDSTLLLVLLDDVRVCAAYRWRRTPLVARTRCCISGEAWYVLLGYV